MTVSSTSIGLIAILILGVGVALVGNARNHEGAKWTAPMPSVGISKKAEARDGNLELSAMYLTERLAHRSVSGKPVDWRVVGPLELKPQARVKALYRSQRLVTADDYFMAASILQRSAKPADLLLAHELSILSVAKGDQRGLWLAAATEDRYLVRTGQNQRFGAQFCRASDGSDVKIYPLQGLMTDAHRAAVSVLPIQRQMEQLPMIYHVGKLRVRPGDPIQYPNT